MSTQFEECSSGGAAVNAFSPGGFGGGGGSWNAGGGGGGYSGGQGAPDSPIRCGGGGGGSFDATNSDGANEATQYSFWNDLLLGKAPSTYSAGYNTGNGFLLIVSLQCVACTVGTYSPHFGATACLTCLIGSFSNYTGKSVCSSCQAGSYSNTTGDQ